MSKAQYETMVKDLQRLDDRIVDAVEDFNREMGNISQDIGQLAIDNDGDWQGDDEAIEAFFQSVRDWAAEVEWAGAERFEMVDYVTSLDDSDFERGLSVGTLLLRLQAYERQGLADATVWTKHLTDAGHSHPLEDLTASMDRSRVWLSFGDGEAR